MDLNVAVEEVIRKYGWMMGEAKMEILLRDLKRELERKIKRYEEQKIWFEDTFKKVEIGKDLNIYHSLQSILSELSILAAEINTIQDHIDMIEIDLK